MFLVVISGGHKDVIEFLIGSCLDLEFTENVCNTFPDIIGEVINKAFTPVSPRKMSSDSSSYSGSADDDFDDLFQVGVLEIIAL